MQTPQFPQRALGFAGTLGKGTAPRRTGRARFPGIRLSSDLRRECVCGWWPVGMDLVVAGRADFTDRRLFGSASDLGFHVAYMFATPNQKISEEEVGAWRAP